MKRTRTRQSGGSRDKKLLLGNVEYDDVSASNLDSLDPRRHAVAVAAATARRI